MKFERPPMSQGQETQAERDRAKAEGLRLKLDKLKEFEPSGNIATDFNKLIDLTSRDGLYKKVDSSDKPEEILAGLVAIRDAWQGALRNPEKVDTANEAKKLFFIDVPQVEIETISRLINFYMEKLSSEQNG